MNVEEHKIRQLVVVGTKLVLVGGIIFAIGAIVYMNSPNLGFEEQSLLSLVIMVSFIVWVVGAIYFGVAGDQCSYFKNRISKQTEMNGNDNDKNQPYGKLKWLDIVILIGVVVAATIFILFYFNQ